MKILNSMKLIQTTDYLLLIDEEAEIKSKPHLCYNSIKNTWNDDVILYQGSMPEYHYNGFQKIIAYYPLSKEAKELDLPLLPPFEVDIEKLAEDRYGKYEASIDIPNKYLREGFIDGYKAAQSSNKQFSLEDVKKAIRKGEELSKYFGNHKAEERESFIQSLSTQKLPKEFIPEYEKDITNGWSNVLQGGDGKPKLKTITNSEGKEELVGTYKY